MLHVDSSNATHYGRRLFTALLGVPLATEKDDYQDTLTLWFHEKKDQEGNPSNKVNGVSDCHILRKNTTVDYERSGGAPMYFVRVCGMRQFQRGLDEITKAIADRGISLTFELEILSNCRRRGGRTQRTRERSRQSNANWTTRLKLSPIWRPSTTTSRNTGLTSISTGTLGTFNMLQPSQSMLKAAHYIPRTGLRS